MLNLNSLLLSSEDPEMLSDFYSKVFDKDPDWTSGDFVGFKVGDGQFVIGPHDKVKGKSNNPERIILGLETEDVEGEFGRITGIEGVKVIALPYHPMEVSEMWLATLTDPDGNFFQLASPMKM